MFNVLSKRLNTTIKFDEFIGRVKKITLKKLKNLFKTIKL